MMSRERGCGALLAAGALSALAMLSSPPSVEAHGGDAQVRLIGQSVSTYDATVKTAPKEPRVGDDFHVMVQLIDPHDLEYASEPTLTATARFLDGESPLARSAQSQYRAPWHEVDMRLDRSGSWRVTLSVVGPEGQGEVSFTVEVQATPD